MIWRIDANRALGRKASEPRASLTVDEHELELIADSLNSGAARDALDTGSLELDVRAAHSALLEAKRR